MARKKAVITPSSETLEPRVYELGFLLSPAVREEDIDTRVDELRSIVTSAGGSVISENRPEFIDLAYQMVKVIDNKNIRFNQGYFGWIKFSLTPTDLKTVTELFEKNPHIIRMIVVKTVSENTILGKRPLSKILKATEREELGDADLIEEIDTDGDDIDLGIAADALPTPVNDDSEDTPVEAGATPEPVA